MHDIMQVTHPPTGDMNVESCWVKEAALSADFFYTRIYILNDRSSLISLVNIASAFNSLLMFLWTRNNSEGKHFIFPLKYAKLYQFTFLQNINTLADIVCCLYRKLTRNFVSKYTY